MLTIGIDPGVTGAVAILPESGIPVIVDAPAAKIRKGNKMRSEYDMHEMASILRSCISVDEDIVVAIEVGIPMPKQSSFSTALTFEGIGLWKGIIAALGYPMHQIRPVEWKKAYGLLQKDKNASILKAKQLYPTADIHLKKHHGRAEALLLASYLQNKLPHHTVNQSQTASLQIDMRESVV